MSYLNSKLLFGSAPIVIDRNAAKVLGLECATVLQQLHYWLTTSRNQKDGRIWVYNTLEGWREDSFPFMSTTSISRRFKKLEERGLVITGNYNKTKMDKTIWYTIDYEKVKELEKEIAEKSIFQSEKSNTQSEKSIPQSGATIPEITQEITQEIITVPQQADEQCKHPCSRTHAKSIAELFNSILDFPNVKSLNDSRFKLIQSRWKQLAKANNVDVHDDVAMLAAFAALFGYIDQSDFLTGRDGRWLNCGFDWIFKQANFTKIIEGNYENKGEAA